MYSPMGEVPLILQGGGAYNQPPDASGAVVLPDITATAKSPYLLYTVLGLAAAYLVFGKGHVGKLW